MRRRQHEVMKDIFIAECQAFAGGRSCTATVARAVGYCLLLTASVLLPSCSSDAVPDPYQPSAPIPMTVGLSGESGLMVKGNTRGNGTVSGGQLTYGAQNSDQLVSRNYNRVGLFALTKNGTGVTDASWERFNVCSSDASPLAPIYTKLTTSGSSQLYYPEKRTEEVDVFAYAPYVSTEAVAARNGGSPYTNISAQTILYTIRQDQTADDDYIDSDILWGCAGTGSGVATAVTSGAYSLLSAQGNNNTVTGGQFITVRDGATVGRVGAYFKQDASDRQPSVVVPMLHRGAKVVMRVKAEHMPQTDLQNARISINLSHIEGLLKISDGSFTVNTAEPDNRKRVVLTDRLGLSALGSGAKVTAFSGTPSVQGAAKSDGTPATSEGEVTYYTCTAIVVPQTCSTAFNLFEVDLYALTSAHTGGNGTNPVVATYGWKPTTAFSFESGKVYTFDMTVTVDGLEVKIVRINDWSDGGNTPHEFEL